MSDYDEERFFDALEKASAKAFILGQRLVHEEIREHVEALREGSLDFEQFVERIEESIQ